MAVSVKRSSISKKIKSVRSGKAEKFTKYFTPMLASLHDRPFDDASWLFEFKWDGYRAIAETGKSNRLYSRNGLSFSQLYEPVAQALEQIRTPAILDGEIVVFNSKGKPDFQALQQYGDRKNPTIHYFVFDCVSINGKSIAHLPLVERKQLAKKLIADSGPVIQFSDHVESEGKALFEQSVSMDLEGIIAKRKDSLYHSGRRSKDWLKIKNHNTQEAIITGYTAPRGSRKHFGALLLAINGADGLRYIGHTGTGFTDQTLTDVYKKMQPLKIDKSPFASKIPVNSKVTWIKPQLVCNVKFTEITQDGILRHPVFQGLRIDKSASETTSIDKPARR